MGQRISYLTKITAVLIEMNSKADFNYAIVGGT